MEIIGRKEIKTPPKVWFRGECENCGCVLKAEEHEVIATQPGGWMAPHYTEYHGVCPGCYAKRVRFYPKFNDPIPRGV